MKKVLLTGSSGGLGKVLARKLLENGDFVVLHYFDNMDEISKLHDEFKDSSIVYQCDIREEEAIKKMYEDLKEYNIDSLINNAAIDHCTDISEKTVDTFVNVYKTNLVGPFMLIKYFGDDINKRNGAIVNISSDDTIDGYDEVTAEYDCSKVALNLLTKMMTNKYENAHINAICFGWLDTPMNILEETEKEFIDFVPLEEASNAVIELLNTNETGKIKVLRK